MRPFFWYNTIQIRNLACQYYNTNIALLLASTQNSWEQKVRLVTWTFVGCVMFIWAVATSLLLLSISLLLFLIFLFHLLRYSSSDHFCCSYSQSFSPSLNLIAPYLGLISLPLYHISLPLNLIFLLSTLFLLISILFLQLSILFLLFSILFFSSQSYFSSSPSYFFSS